MVTDVEQITEGSGFLHFDGRPYDMQDLEILRACYWMQD